ncbi:MULTISPECIES: tRNA(Met) cytidine acetate ligase [Caproicibacterium]|uniref:tRNA(Met) cytidine acetate ligase n=1 Tax=Caproicibacterium argilliputei TaxID=3030016 RepID=A0AA97H4D0_9FIRM|nr:nucleotidyltransferase family protein [Caproicibacterium argilliputei]WOC33273.1 nucleotidyltransferase family protein [Caproicibacterium argilliputei]
MRLAVIIAEYNPFHKGHAALVQAVRRAGATHVAAVMSGCFVQRGDAACLSKWARTRQALACGVDLVAELPVPWAVSGAECFARGGVALADALGADVLAFGSECGNAAALQRLAGLLCGSAAGEALHGYLSQGMAFAAARERAVANLAGEKAAVLLRQPNNILGIEYCKAMQAQHTQMACFTVSRQGAAHDSPAESPTPSASRVRSLLESGGVWETALPAASAAVVRTELAQGRAPASLQQVERAVLYCLRTLPEAAYHALPDVSEGLENRLRSAARCAGSMEELYAAAKTKRYSHARIRRLALSAFLGLREKDAVGTPPYLRILGFGAQGRAVLARAAQKGALPLLTRTSDSRILDSRGKNVVELENRAADVWALCCPRPAPSGLDRTTGILVFEKGCVDTWGSK